MEKEFFGRKRELELLNSKLDAVREGGSRPGRCLLVSGQHGVGKSRLVQEFVSQSGVPSVYFTASRLPPGLELERFLDEVAHSDLPGREDFGSSADNWSGSLHLFARTLPSNQPTIVVIDELPYLIQTVESIEGILKTVWDRVMYPKPVLFILIGSDKLTMESINHYDRPFHMRGTPMRIAPLTPADIAEIVELKPADAFDAHLITGGLPLLCGEWEPGVAATKYVAKAFEKSTSPLLVTAPLNAGQEIHAPEILPAIATHERTYNAIKQRSGLADSTFKRSMDALLNKGIVTADRPLSTKSSKSKHYRISDSYRWFWFHFINSQLTYVDRSRPEIAMKHFVAGWNSWRERAIGPVIRESVARLILDDAPWDFTDAIEIGAYWTRSNDVEVDLVAGDRAPVANRIGFVGSIKWYESQAFSRRDGRQLAQMASRVPGASEDTPLVAVSRVEPTEDTTADITLTAEDLITAWK